MEGVIQLGKLKRIQTTLNQFVKDKLSNINTEFDWNKSLIYINRGKGELLPVIVNSNFEIEKTKNIYYERFIIENQLKSHFLKPYNLSKPK